MSAYHRILSSHFSDMEIQTLVDIFPLLRESETIELGFQLLKGANLYDSFFHFIVQYAAKHKLIWYTETELWRFMFSNDIWWMSQGMEQQTLVCSERGVIVLPPFATELNMGMADTYDFAHSYNRKYIKFSISNIEDVEYPIQIMYSMSNTLIIPRSTYSVKMMIYGDYATTEDLLLWHKNMPKTIKKMQISIFNNYNNLEMGEILKQYGDLEFLCFKHSCAFCNIQKVGFPSSLKRVDFELELGDNFQQMVINCVNDCPSLTSIILRNLTTDMRYHRHAEKIEGGLLNYDFKLLETSEADGITVYQFIK